MICVALFWVQKLLRSVLLCLGKLQRLLRSVLLCLGRLQRLDGTEREEGMAGPGREW